MENQFLRFKAADLIHFLQYITNNNYKPIDFIYKIGKEPIKDTLVNVNEFLNELFSKNNLNKDIIFKNSILINPDYKGLKSHFTSKDEMEKEVINDCLHLTGNIPSPQTLLMCNEETTSEEITAFLYKAILCEYNALFIIMKIESLEVEIRQDILDILNTLFIQNRKNMKSCLLFIYDDMSTDIIQEIKKINGHNDLNIPNNDLNKINDDTIEIIYSDASGVGKSTIIKDEILKNNKNYIYCPVGGEFTREEVIKRLKNLKIDKNCVIHLDLNDTSKVNLMKEFLFSLLITKWYSRGENIFYLGNKINIKIEVPFGFTNFKRKFPILNLFKNKTISINQLPSLKISKELSSNMQITFNYLQFYKDNKISDNNINIPGITLNDFQPKINAISLNQQQCQNLLNEYFNVPKSTYYQKLCFINIIASQLIFFTNNFYLEVQQLKEAGNLQNIRNFMIEGLIKNTQHFTKGAYSNLIESQDMSQKRQTGKYDEEKELQEAIKKLENKEVISYKQIKPSLIFCNLDGGSLSIITNCLPNEKE